MKKYITIFGSILWAFALLYIKSAAAHSVSDETVHEFLKAEVINYQKFVTATYPLKYNDISKEQMICFNHVNSKPTAK